MNLLLEWGSAPHRVDLDVLFDTYRSDLFARFQDLGVDLTASHALAGALAEHTSNRPLFGFAKRNRERHPKIQTELNIALASHVNHLTEHGVMPAAALYESPFTDITPRGPDGLFSSEQVDELMSVLDGVRRTASAA